MRRKKIITLLMCALLLTIPLSSCLFPGYQVGTGSTAVSYPSQGDAEVKESATDPHIEVTDNVLSDLKNTLIDDVTVYNLGEAATVQTDYSDKTKILNITVTGAEMTKSIAEYDASQFTFSLDDLDTIGFDGTRLTGNFSFVFVSLEVTNPSEEKRVFAAANLSYYVIGDDGCFIGQGGCFFFFDKSGENSSDYGYYLMEPGETLPAVVGYYVEDGPSLSQGFILVNLYTSTATGKSEWFALTERE